MCCGCLARAPSVLHLHQSPSASTMMPRTSMEHPWHEHALTRRELSEQCLVKCGLCNQRFNGPTYCCLNCDYFLDESCALMEFPSQLQHPSHPQHPLVLDGMYYSCGSCSFYRLHVLKAAAARPAQPPPEVEDHNDEKGMIQQYLSHGRPQMSSFYLQKNHHTWCSFCHKSGSEFAGYGHCACNCFPEELCAREPQELQHPLHCQHPLNLQVVVASSKKMFTCAACELTIHKTAAYCCNECQFNLDLHCATSILPPKVDQETEEGQGGVYIAEHFSHPQFLSEFRIKDGVYLYIRCEICRDYISGEAYGCIDCRFFLHKSCKEKLPRGIQHFLHPQHPLALLRQESKCNSCSEDIHGIAFSCQTCLFDLHMVCALQTLSAVEAGAAEASLLHFAHDHPLALHFFNKWDTNLLCKACKQPIAGLAYACSICSNFRLHKSCATLPLELEHAFHPLHPLILLQGTSAGYFYCSICDNRSTGFAYCCAECNFFLNMECASLNPTLKHPRHEHRLAYFDESKYKTLECSSCHQSCKRDFYCCEMCNFGLHWDCLPLPPTIGHECHPYHPLVLFDRFVDGNPDDQYCDYCEDIRHPDCGVYRCEECWFSTHIECVIPTINPKVEPEEEAGQDIELDQANIEIANLKVESEGETEEDPEWLNKEIANLKSKIEILQRNVCGIEGNIESSMAKLKELEIEREEELNSIR